MPFDSGCFFFPDSICLLIHPKHRYYNTFRQAKQITTMIPVHTEAIYAVEFLFIICLENHSALWPSLDD